MTEKNPPVWMQSGTYNAVDDRLVTGLLADRDRGASGDDTAILGGVVPGWNQLEPTAAGNSMQVSVASGTAIVPALGATPPGAYIVYNEGATAFTLDIEASGNPRHDILYAEVEDQTTGGDESEWRLAVAKGQPSASPTDPSLPAGTLPIARVRVVPASQNGGVNKVTDTQVTDLRRMLSSLGGVHLTRNGIPNPPHAPGRLLYNEDSDFLYVSNGARWDYFYTYQHWMDFFAALRPRHASNWVKGKIPSGSGPKAKWDPTPNKANGSGQIPILNVTNMKSPSGEFKISISAYGRTQNNNGSGHMSVRALQGSDTVFTPNTGWKSISFYSRAWEHHGATFLATGLPKNEDINFRAEFRRNGADNNVVEFDNYYILVEPVL